MVIGSDISAVSAIPSGFIPNSHAVSYRWRSVISFSSCFSGGVFMGACLLDLIPDVEEIFKKVLATFSDVCALPGFVILLNLIVNDCHTKRCSVT